MTFCDATVGSGASFWTYRNRQTDKMMDGQTDVEVEIVI